MKKRKLIVFSGPSGSGKTTLVKSILQKKIGVEFSISATSRNPRGDEINGREYYFLNLKEFKNKIDDDQFVEYEEVYTNKFYGTLKSEVNRIWNNGNHVIFDIDVFGGLKIKNKFPKETIAIFVQPPDLKTLEKRLRKRKTDNDSSLKERLSKAELEMESASKFDFIIINNKIEFSIKSAIKKVEEFLNA